MQNVEYKVEGKGNDKKLIITVKLSERHGLSNSGNTVTIAGTQGNVKIGEGDIAFGLNVYTKDRIDEERVKSAKAKGYDTWEAYQNALKGGKAA